MEPHTIGRRAWCTDRRNDEYMEENAMTEKCPYCGAEMIPGRLCANDSASLEFNGDAPHFPDDFFIAGPYFLRRNIQLNALHCKVCQTVIFRYDKPIA